VSVFSLILPLPVILRIYMYACFSYVLIPILGLCRCGVLCGPFSASLFIFCIGVPHVVDASLCSFTLPSFLQSVGLTSAENENTVNKSNHIWIPGVLVSYFII